MYMGQHKKAKKVQSPVKSNRPGKQKQWTEVGMMAAMKALEMDFALSIEAARNHGVPPTTLSGRVEHGAKPVLSYTTLLRNKMS